MYLLLLQVSNSWLEQPENVKDQDGLTTSSLRLRFSLQSSLLREGEGHVSCVAEIPDTYKEETREVLTTRPPYHASVLGAGPTTGKKKKILCKIMYASLIIIYS